MCLNDGPAERATPHLAAAHILPSPTRQLVYFGTGALSGLSVVPIELLWARHVDNSPPKSLARGFRSHAPALAGRAAVRFWIFDVAKKQYDRHLSDALPLPVRGGMGGATGGVAEVCAQALVNGRVPKATEVGLQGAKLFCAFGTYTFLQSRLAEEGPPRPFALCWACGAAAGSVASTLEGAKPRELLRATVPKGALVIGTTIAVQVVSCWDILQAIGG